MPPKKPAKTTPTKSPAKKKPAKTTPLKRRGLTEILREESANKRRRSTRIRRAKPAGPPETVNLEDSGEETPDEAPQIIRKVGKNGSPRVRTFKGKRLPAALVAKEQVRSQQPQYSSDSSESELEPLNFMVGTLPRTPPEFSSEDEEDMNNVEQDVSVPALNPSAPALNPSVPALNPSLPALNPSLPANRSPTPLNPSVAAPHSTVPAPARAPTAISGPSRSRTLTDQNPLPRPSASSSSRPDPPPLENIPIEGIESEDEAAYESDDAGYLRIRQKTKIGPDGKALKPGRGVGNGAKLEERIEKDRNGRKKKLTRGPGGVPAQEGWISLFTHQIGLAVFDLVPMTTKSFGKMGEVNNQIVLNHLRLYFEITDDEEDVWLKRYIFIQARERFIAWKSRCHAFYKKNPGVLPYEFRKRKDQWNWLVEHFNTPEFQKLSNHMIDVRNVPNHINHHSGKMSYIRRVAKYKRLGHKTPHLAALTHMYKDDPNAKKFLDEMEKRMDELMHVDEMDSGIGLENPITEEDELRVINEVTAKHKPPTKRGRKPSSLGAKSASTAAYMDLQKQLEDTKAKLVEAEQRMEERLKENDEKWEARIKGFEDMVRNNAAAFLQSDGESNLAAPARTAA